MANFDLKKNVDEVTAKICRGIASSKVRREIMQEYADHIEDEVYNLTLGGMSEEEAFRAACQNLGEIKKLRHLLSAVHNETYKINLPKDLRNYILKKTALSLCTVLLALLPAIIIGVILYNVLQVHVIFFILYCVITLLLSLVRHYRYYEELFAVLKDKTVFGEIVSVTPKAAYEGGDNGSEFSFRRKEYGLIIRAKVLGGDEHSFCVYPQNSLEKYDINEFYGKYKAGMRILHVRGTDHIQIFSDPSEYGPEPENLDCVVCGCENGRKRTACENCGHTLHIV